MIRIEDDWLAHFMSNRGLDKRLKSYRFQLVTWLFFCQRGRCFCCWFYWLLLCGFIGYESGKLVKEVMSRECVDESFWWFLASRLWDVIYESCHCGLVPRLTKKQMRVCIVWTCSWSFFLAWLWLLSLCRPAGCHSCDVGEVCWSNCFCWYKWLFKLWESLLGSDIHPFDSFSCWQRRQWWTKCPGFRQ